MWVLIILPLLKIKYNTWNPEKGEIDINCFEGVTSIINLAGSSISKRWTSTYKTTILNSRINSLRTLHKGIKVYGSDTITSFVSASAVGIYPHSISSFYSEEETKLGDNFLANVVTAWEKEIDTFKRFDFNVAAIRIGIVFSKDGGALPQMVKPINSYVGAAFGSGEQWQSWIHIKDLARLFVFASTHQLKGVFNGVAPNPVSNAKLTKELAKVLEKPIFMPNIPEFLMRIILGEMSYLLYASQRVSSKKIEIEGFKFNYTTVCSSIEDFYGSNSKHQKTDSAYAKEYI